MYSYTYMNNSMQGNSTATKKASYSNKETLPPIQKSIVKRPPMAPTLAKTLVLTDERKFLVTIKDQQIKYITTDDIKSYNEGTAKYYSLTVKQTNNAYKIYQLQRLDYYNSTQQRTANRRGLTFTKLERPIDLQIADHAQLFFYDLANEKQLNAEEIYNLLQENNSQTGIRNSNSNFKLSPMLPEPDMLAIPSTEALQLRDEDILAFFSTFHTDVNELPTSKECDDVEDKQRSRLG